MVGIAALLTTVERVCLIELGVEIVNVPLAHLTRDQIEAPSIVVRFKAHVSKHVRELTLVAVSPRHWVY